MEEFLTPWCRRLACKELTSRRAACTIEGFASRLYQHDQQVFQHFRDAACEARGVGAIDNAMVVRERQWQQQPRDRLAVADHRLQPGPRQTEDGDFGIVDDRREPGAAD